MRIWLATVGEPLPMDGEDVRLLRTAQFAQWLSERGHTVVFWTGTMDHYRRRLRADKTTIYEIGPNYSIVALAGRLYRRSISFSRFMNHKDVAISFSKTCGDFPAPDVIVTSFPTEELCSAVLDYAEPRGIPVLVDVRDLWPDVFSDALPKPLRFLAPALFGGIERKSRRVLRRATAISGPANAMVDWGVERSGRSRSARDFWFPFTYPPADNGTSDSEPDFLRADGASDRYWFCFFGALSVRYNLEMVVDAFRTLEGQGVPASAIICGSGDAEEQLKARAAGASNIYFPGWVSRGTIRAIMHKSAAGLFPYNTADYFNNLPNKVCEYLAGSLPIISCTQGEVRDLIERFGCGFFHADGPDALQALVTRVVKEPQLLRDAKEKASDTYRRFFETDAVFADALDRLSSLRAG